MPKGIGIGIGEAVSVQDKKDEAASKHRHYRRIAYVVLIIPRARARVVIFNRTVVSFEVLREPIGNLNTGQGICIGNVIVIYIIIGKHNGGKNYIIFILKGMKII